YRTTKENKQQKPCICTKEKDFAKASTCAHELIFNGRKNLPEVVTKEFEQKAFELVKKCEEETRDLLIVHKGSLERIAHELEEQTVLRASDIEKLLVPVAVAA